MEYKHDIPSHQNFYSEYEYIKKSMKLLESKKSQNKEFGFNILPGRPINSRGEGCKKDLALDKCLQMRVQKDVSPSMSPPKRK